ncbi:MAG: polyprenyl synthetase [Desulfuromonas sp.]|nr:MAG: polyprenyl synthetase [Desulfuromonas sp.]
MELSAYLRERTALVERSLLQVLPPRETRPRRLHEAMHYSMFAGGKRIRPILMLAACEAIGGDVRKVLPAACAIEMIHTYSLIHDDLPAMDDDDFRRGNPTSHRVYGEALAILAGDALLTEAFVLLSDPKSWPEVDSQVVCQVMHLLSAASGAAGMVGGQVVDIESEGQRISQDELEYVHRHKTGALILAALEVGGLIGGAGEAAMTALQDYGKAVGLAFQVADDVLDVVGDQQELGKDVGSDEERGKATYPTLMGLDGACDYAQNLKQKALEALEPLGTEATPLREIARYIVDRTS